MHIDLRDAGVAALVAAAGGLAYGLARLSGSGWLASTTPVLGAKGWQILNVGAYAVSVASVSAPGRVDDEMAAQARRRARAADPAAGTGIPRDHWSRGRFAPAGWAFAIWGAIFLGEAVFAATCAAPLLGRPPPDDASAAVYAAVAPWWALACGLQSLWCAAFRPAFRAPRRFWISAALLFAEAGALGGAYVACRAFAAEDAMPLGAYWRCHFPLAMHFGWIAAAALVNANSFARVAGDARTRRIAAKDAKDRVERRKSAAPSAAAAAAAALAEERTQAIIAEISAIAAAAFGVACATLGGEPVVAAVAAWALFAVAADGGRREGGALEKTEEGRAAMARVVGAARTGARASLLAAGVAIARGAAAKGGLMGAGR
jgi:hypothetical protein